MAESKAGHHERGASSATKDAGQASAVAETEAKSNNMINHNLRLPQAAEPGDGKSKLNAQPPPVPPPSAPPLDVCPEPHDDNDNEDRKKYFSTVESRDEVERWLLSHLPTLQRRDIEMYCRCLLEDGFDSILVLQVLEEADLHFMRKGHRKYFVKRLLESGKPRPDRISCVSRERSFRSGAATTELVA